MGRDLPRVGVSACLLGAPVRYDGADKAAAFRAEDWRDAVEWVPVCPEVEMGMPVPREPIRLERAAAGTRPVGTRLVGSTSRRDWTDAMAAWAARRLARLAPLRLAGYVLKARSPSCGPGGVPLHDAAGGVAGEEAGRFAVALRAAFPDLPVADEALLADPPARDAFLARVRARHRSLV